MCSNRWGRQEQRMWFGGASICFDSGAAFITYSGAPFTTFNVHPTRLPYWCCPGKRHEPGCRAEIVKRNAATT